MQVRHLFFLLFLLAVQSSTAAPIPDNNSASPSSSPDNSTSSSSAAAQAPTGTASNAAAPAASSQVSNAQFESADRPDPVPNDDGSNQRRSFRWERGQQSSQPEQPEATPTFRSSQHIYLPPSSSRSFRNAHTARKALVSTSPRCLIHRTDRSHRCTKRCASIDSRSKRSLSKRSPEPVEFAHNGGGGLSLGPYGGEVIDGKLVRFNETYNAGTIAKGVLARHSGNNGGYSASAGSYVDNGSGNGYSSSNGYQTGNGDTYDSQAYGYSGNSGSQNDWSQGNGNGGSYDNNNNNNGYSSESYNADSSSSNSNPNAYSKSNSASNYDPSNGYSSSSKSSSKTNSNSYNGYSSGSKASPNSNAYQDSSYSPTSSSSSVSASSPALPGTIYQDCANLRTMYNAMGGASWSIQYGWNGQSQSQSQGQVNPASSTAAAAPAWSSSTGTVAAAAAAGGATLGVPSANYVEKEPKSNGGSGLQRRRNNGYSGNDDYTNGYSTSSNQFTDSSASTSPSASDYTSTCCSWYGVTCSPSNGRVQSLDLGSNQLSGSLSSAVFALNGLIRLNISNNPITFVPDGFGGLDSLRNVYMSALNLTSMIVPPSLQSLPTLVNIDISNNKFIGPVSLVSDNLVIVNVESNQLSGAQFQGTMANLQRVNLAGNGMQGGLVDLSKAKELLVFDGSLNNFTGPIFDITSLTNLTKLDLHSNSLTSNLPPTLTHNPSLISLDLSSNLFTGSLPLEEANPLLKQCHILPNPGMICPGQDELSDPNSLASRCADDCSGRNVDGGGALAGVGGMNGTTIAATGGNGLTTSGINPVKAGIPVNLLPGEGNGSNSTILSSSSSSANTNPNSAPPTYFTSGGLGSPKSADSRIVLVVSVVAAIVLGKILV